MELKSIKSLQTYKIMNYCPKITYNYVKKCKKQQHKTTK